MVLRSAALRVENAFSGVGYPVRMSTRLEKPIRREVEIDGERYTVTLAPDGIRLAKKRFRSGVALSWKELWSLSRRREPARDRGSR